MRSPCHKKILIVDDSATIRAFARQIFSKAGYDVETSADLEVCRNPSAPADLILLDVDLGNGVDGSEALSRLRKACATDSGQVVLFSSLPTGDLEALVEARGADGMIPKSAKSEELVAYVRSLLGSREEAAS